MNFHMIAAVSKNWGIANNNKIPWHIPLDLKHFKSTTTETLGKYDQNVVIMGRATWESLPKKYRPLKNRINIVISSKNIDDADYCFKSLDKSLNFLNELNGIEEVFIVGGQRMYEEGINHPNCENLYITHIDKEIECDRFFPKIDDNKYKLYNETKNYNENGYNFKFCIYKKIIH